MQRWRGAGFALLSMVFLCTGTAPAHAAPWVPSSDGEIVETLPAVSGWSRDERARLRELVARPRDESVALAAARSYLDLARAQGDARFAGYAAGVLRAWEPLTEQTPNAILVMHATVAQFLHDFDGAERTLLLALRANPSNAQGWLTLATIQRVRGRYAASDLACQALVRLRQNLYAIACLAENNGLRGDHAAARQSIDGLLASPALQTPAQAATRQWLMATLAEVDELAGQTQAADAAYRQTLGRDASAYDVIAYSDFLLGQKRPAEVLPLLKSEPRSDAVLLRLVIATQRLDAEGKLPPAQRESARKDREELAERFDAAALRPGTQAQHAREHAMFALDVQNDPPKALAISRLNVKVQREPIDLLVFARAAAAAKDDAARAEVRALMREIGLSDARVDAALG
ncbi:MAG: hypothetical protein EOO26_00300 [Comamonadaceae bacterium]|nr:MAG: hypothetical protein EOO26_00300 [Comamonadaceae bacterium]